jgi:hypothetical protein
MVMLRALRRTGSATWRCADAGSTRAALRPTQVSGLYGTLVANSPPAWNDMLSDIVATAWNCVLEGEKKRSDQLVGGYMVERRGGVYMVGGRL